MRLSLELLLLATVLHSPKDSRPIPVKGPPMPPAVNIAPSDVYPTVTLAWNPSTGTNVAGYNIYYGVASRVYTNAVPVGNVTNTTVTLPAYGVRYYFAATALDAQGLESVYSDEVSWMAGATVPTNYTVSVTVQQSPDMTNWISVTNLPALTFSNGLPSPLYWRAVMGIQAQ